MPLESDMRRKTCPFISQVLDDIGACLTYCLGADCAMWEEKFKPFRDSHGHFAPCDPPEGDCGQKRK